MESQPQYGLDEALDHIGFGRYQIQLLVLCGATQLADATELLALSLLSKPVQCAFGVEKWQSSWLAAVVFAGMLIGAYLSGFVSDRYGRRMGFGVTTLLVVCFGLLSAGAQSFETLMLARFGVGMGVGGAGAALSLFAEHLPSSRRGAYLILFFIFFSVGAVMEALIALWVMPNWRLLLILTAVPSILLLIVFPWVPESPRFLLVQGRIEEAERNLKHLASVNGARLPHGRLSNSGLLTGRGAEGRRSQTPGPSAEPRETGGSAIDQVAELFKGKILRRLTWKVWVLFLVMAILYYALVQLTVDLSLVASEGKKENDDPCIPAPRSAYVSVVVINSGELPGLIIASVLLDRIGRRKTIALMSLATALFCSILLIPKHFFESLGMSAVVTATMFGARAFALGFNQSLWIYTAEAYPTKSRALGIGAATAMARVGGFVSPFMAQDLPHSVSVGVCVACGVLSAIIAVRLPSETMSRSLKDFNVPGLLGPDEEDAHNSDASEPDRTDTPHDTEEEED